MYLKMSDIWRNLPPFIVKQDQISLLMGGSRWPGQSSMDNIFIYDTKTRKWTYSEYKLPHRCLYFFGRISSKTDTYIIIFGGQITIWIMDVKIMQFRKRDVVNLSFRVESF